MNELSVEKTMTVKEIANVLGVSRETISQKAKELYPNLIEKGKESRFNEIQVTKIKNNLVKKYDVVTAIDRNEIVKQAMQILIEDNEKLQKENEIMKPKALVYDKFLSSESWQTMNDIAHIIGIGRNRLYEVLRNRKILMGDNTPYQEYMKRGYFKVIDKPIDMNGQIILKKQTLVNSKGLEFISKIIEKTSVYSVILP